MRRTLLSILLTILFLSLACQVSEEERISKVLNRREEALQKRDLSLYLSCISKDYQHQGEDIHRLRNRMEGYFRNFNQIRYSSWDRSIQLEGEKAIVIQQFHIEVEREGRKSSHNGKEALYFVKEGRDWRIIKGL